MFNSDYPNLRTKLNELLPSYVRNDVIDNLFENAFNRFLTKEDSVVKVGSLGRSEDPSARPQINELTPHRQAFQLQPLSYVKTGDIDYLISSKDLIGKLELIGVNSEEFSSWGQTEQFNFAPPVDFDKIINFSEYYWTDANTTPDYITIKNPCSVASARLSQRRYEHDQLGTPVIESIIDENTIRVPNNITNFVSNDSIIDIVGSASNDGVYNVVDSYYDNGYTYIVLLENINVVQSQNGSISLDTLLEQSLSERNIVCSNSTGWDSTSWDEDTNWDGGGYQLPNNPWSNSNRWVHRIDLNSSELSTAIQAKMPIIEYDGNIELNKHIVKVHKWLKKSDSNAWTETTTGPELEDIYTDSTLSSIKPSFFENWVYNGIESIAPSVVSETSPITTLNNVTSDQSLRLVSNSNFSTFTFPAIHRNKIVKGSYLLRVYVNGVRQRNNFYELTQTSTVFNYPAVTIRGIQFTSPRNVNDYVEIYIDPVTSSDIGFEIVPVRTSVDSNNIEVVDITEYGTVEQQKSHIGDYPLFNLYNIEGNFLGTSKLFRFKIDKTQQINNFVRRRIAFNGTFRQPVFVHDLSDDSNRLLCYKNDGVLQTIWRTSEPSPTLYTPKKVNEFNEIPSSSGEPVDWEVPDQMRFNPSHDLKKELSFSELVAHFNSVAQNQPMPATFSAFPTYSSRLQYTYDYGIGGTIKEHNYGFDNLLSSMFTDISNPNEVIKFAGQQYNELQNNIQQLISENFQSYFKQAVDYSSTLDRFIDEVIGMFESNVSLDRLYGDSGSYDETTRQGIRNWIATLPLLGLATPVSPLILDDPNLNVKKLRHHDGHTAAPSYTQSFTKTLYQSLIESSLTSTRKVGWSPSQAADGGAIVPSRTDLTIERLRAGDYWLSSTAELSMLDVVAISSTAPSNVNNRTGSLWYSVQDDIVYELQNQQWLQTSKTVDDLWTTVNLNDILLEVLLTIEGKLFEICKTVSIDRTIDLTWTPNRSDMESAFREYTSNRNINNPYDTDYDSNNPFTWNYIDIPVTSPSVNFPYAKDPELWSGRYEAIYEAVFNTPYPHLEPWRLQGFKSKPEWWDQEYKGSGRRWTEQMWNNIKMGIVPSQYSTNGTVPTYTFVCVNTTDQTSTNGYGPDDLLPPYFEIPNNSPQASIDVYLSNQTFINQFSLISSSGVDQPYDFGDGGIFEQEWKANAVYQYDILSSKFLKEPIKTLFFTFGFDFVKIGHLYIDKSTQKVPSHRDILFHGEIDETGQVSYSKGINQWFVNFNRFKDYDNNISGFDAKWRQWTPKLTYQTDTFIDGRQLSMSTDRFQFTPEDYKVLVKESPSQEIIDITGLQFTVSTVGKSIFKNSRKVPSGAGSDWEFTIKSIGSWKTSTSIFPALSNIVDSINVIDSIINFNQPHHWSTGDFVNLDSVGSLPRPLRAETGYYVIKVNNTSIKLAQTPVNAEIGDNISFLSDGGTAQIWVQTPERGFLAQGGKATAVEWKINRLAEQPETVQLPVTVKGVQGLINFFYGYVKWLDSVGIKGNPENEILDPDTGKILSTLTEIERNITLLYSGLGESNFVVKTDGQSFECEVDPLTGFFTIPSGQSMEDFTEVYFYSPALLPNGIVEVQPYYTVYASGNRFKVASSLQNARDGISVTLGTNGSPPIYVSRFKSEDYTLSDWVEFNPFRNSLWIPTERGILSDVVRGPYRESEPEITIEDSTGTRLSSDQIFVFREDKGTKITIPVTSNDLYQSVHFGSGRFYVNQYEHAICFSNYTIDENLIYDPFLGLHVGNIDSVTMIRQRESFARPSVGGYFLTDGQLVSNFEKQTNDTLRMYDQFSTTDYDEFSKSLIGYDDPEFLSELNVTDKTKFIFWKGMIQSKGSRQSVDAFINSKQFVDAQVDEFWAYKTSTHGGAGLNFDVDIEIDPTDLIGSDILMSGSEHNLYPSDFNSDFDDSMADTCVYSLDQETDPDFNVFTGGIEDKWALRETPFSSLMTPLNANKTVFEFSYSEGTESYVQMSSQLVEQYTEDSSTIGDFNVTEFNRYGFQVTFSDLLPPQVDSTNGVITANIFMIGTDNGVGNLYKVTLNYDGSQDQATLTFNKKIEDAGDFVWDEIITYDVNALIQPTNSIGIYWDNDQDDLGIVFNTEDQGFIELSGSDNTFTNFSAIVNVDFNITGSDQILSVEPSIELITSPRNINGLPYTITPVCAVPLVGDVCNYPLDGSYNEIEAVDKYKEIFTNRVPGSIQSLDPVGSPLSYMEFTHQVSDSDVYATAFNQYASTELLNNDNKFNVSGDILIEPGEIYGLTFNADNVVVSSLDSGRISAGILLRGATVNDDNAGVESFLEVEIQQQYQQSGNASAVILRYGIDSTDVNVTSIHELSFPISAVELMNSVVNLYIDGNDRKIGVIINGTDNGFLQDLVSEQDFVFPDNNSFRNMSVELFCSTSNLTSADSNLNNNIELSLDTNVANFSFNGILPICNQVKEPNDVIDYDTQLYDFDWGSSTSQPGDNVLPITGFGSDETVTEVVDNE